MSVIDDYLEKISPSQKESLERIRKIVKSVIPEAEEVISYGMPSFKYQDHYLIGFAAFKNHMSLFPTAEPIEVLKNKLANYLISKGTIQFTSENPIPEDLITEIILIRLNNIS